MFKAQILAELVKQFPGRSKTFLGALADKMAKSVTEESKIEGAIAALKTGPIPIEDLEAVFQAEGDRRATDAVETHKRNNPSPTDPPNPPAPKDKDKPSPGETPVEKQIRELAEKLAAMELKEKQAQGKSALLAKMKEKGIPERLAKRVSVADDTDLDALVTELEGEYKEEQQSYTTQGLKSNSFVPGGGGGGKAGETTKSADAIKAFTDKLNKSAETEKK